MIRTTDRSGRERKAKSPFVQARKQEVFYAKQLRKVARFVQDIIDGFPAGDPSALPVIEQLLKRYSDTLRPWAEAVAARMIAEVAARDQKAWNTVAKQMSASLRQELRTAPTGKAVQEILANQVHLITSLPTEAAKRVHRLTLEGLENSTRASEIAKEIMRTGEVTQSRANLIARTEVSRTSTALTQARAEHIGSTGYIWRTSKDSDVRESHRKMEGRFVAWDEPPTLDGLKGHAGALPNCRCYCEPVIPDA